MSYSDPVDAKIRTSAMKSDILTREEERALAESWRASRCQRSRDKLIMSHQKLVVGMARRFMRTGLPFRDLVNEGNIGLMEAVERYDPDTGNRFATYASWWAFTCMQEFVLRNVSVVRLGRSRPERAMLRGIVGGAQREHNDAASSELEARMRGALAPRTVSLHDPIGGEDGSLEVMDTIKDESIGDWTFMAGTVMSEWRELIERFLPELGERESTVVQARYLTENPKTLREIARELGISAERVRQIEQGAMNQLRRSMERAGFALEDVLGDD